MCNMMKTLVPLIAAMGLASRVGSVSGFSLSPLVRPASSRTTLQSAVPSDGRGDGAEPSESGPRATPTTTMRRRAVLSDLLALPAAALSLSTGSLPAAASDLPSVTSAEFDTILKDSAKSILSVELSGPKSETALIRLADGTAFTISDLVESSTDPRSPLKLVARCRLYKVPVKNTGLISAVGGGEGSIVSESGRKKKNYMNPRVKEAQRKEQEKRERMAEDERERLEELYRMEGREEGFLSE